MDRSARPHRAPRLALLAAASLAACSAHATTFTWSDGSFIAGVTAPHPLAAGDVLEIVAGGNKVFNGGAFTNNGTVNWNADTLFLQSGATLTNNGTWNALSDNALVYNGGAAPSFLNTGTFRKAAGAGATQVQGTTGFVNRGAVDAQVGRIEFTGGSRFENGSVFSGAGQVAMVSGTNTFAGTSTSANLRLEGGDAFGEAAVARGLTRWSGGSLSGGWTVAGGHSFEAVSGANKVLFATLTNAGTLTWNTTDTLFLQSGGTLVNAGTLEAAQSTNFAYNGGSAPSIQNQAGATIRARDGVTLRLGNVTNLANAGTLDAQAGAQIRYEGSATFNVGTVFSGAGSNVAVGNNTFAGAYTSANLVLESGTHNGADALAQGSTAWTGGQLSGTWTVAQGHAFNGSGGTNKVLLGTLTNKGTLDWATTDTLFLQSGGTLVNESQLVASASTLFAYNGGAATTLRNQAGATLRAAAGNTLTLGNGLGLVNSGTLQADTGAAIVVQGGAQFDDGSRFTGAGSVFADGNNTWAGTLQAGNLQLRSGAHNGANAVVNGSLGWTGGLMTGAWTVASGHELRGESGANKVLIGVGVLANDGTVNWNTTDTLFLQSGATLANRSLWQSNASHAIVYNGGAGTAFVNTGTLRAAAGTTLTLGNGLGLLNQAGTLDAVGSIVVGGGARFEAGSRFTGAGATYADGNNTWAGAFTSANLQLRSGNHVGDNALVQGRASWAGGALSGTWDVAAGQVLAATDGANKLLLGGTLANHGRIEWNTADTLFLQSGATLSNAGTMVVGDGAVAYNGGAGPSFVNGGLLAKTTGAGNYAIGNGTGFVNHGTVNVASGAIVLPNDFTNDGTLKGTGAFSLTGTLTNAGHVAPGASPGTLTLNGSYLQTAAGSFDVELASTAAHDLLLVNGNATLGGTLALQCFGNCSLAAGQQLVILDATGTLAGTFAGVTMAGFGSGAFNVVYDTVGSRVLLEVTQSVSAVPEPAAWLMWLAGAAFLARRRLVR